MKGGEERGVKRRRGEGSEGEERGVKGRTGGGSEGEERRGE